MISKDSLAALDPILLAALSKAASTALADVRTNLPVGDHVVDSHLQLHICGAGRVLEDKNVHRNNKASAWAVATVLLATVARLCDKQGESIHQAISYAKKSDLDPEALLPAVVQAADVADPAEVAATKAVGDKIAAALRELPPKLARGATSWAVNVVAKEV